MARTWTDEQKKEFAEKMKERRLAKQAAQTTPGNDPLNLQPENQKRVSEGTALPQAETPSNATPQPAGTTVDPLIQAKLDELEAAIKRTNELNDKLETKEKERTEQFTTGMKGMSVQEQKHVVFAHQSKKDKMKERLKDQPKVRIFIPLEGKEKKGTQLPVTINGYRVNVPKGMYVDVPEQVGEIIKDSLNQTQEALDNEYLIDNSEQKQVALS